MKDIYKLQAKLIHNFQQDFKAKIGCMPIIYVPSHLGYLSLNDLDECFKPFLPVLKGKPVPLTTQLRIRRLVELRAIYCNIAKKMNFTLKEIARHIKYADHSTVIHVLKLYKALMETDENFQNKVISIENHIKKMTNHPTHESQNLDVMPEV